MRIATYNVWDSDAGMPARFECLVNEIVGISADIICLQEVSDREKHERFSQLCGYGHSHWQSRTGLSVLSRYHITEAADLEYGAYACVCAEGRTLLVINVHLPWEKASLREKAIVDIIGDTEDIKADYTFMAGDFNCSENSSVHRFLTGEQSLLGADSYYFDLAEAAAELNGRKASATLNFRENPRWGIAEPRNTIEVNGRFDRILLKNPYPAPLPVLKGCSIFGTGISDENGLAASDHYGVAAEIGFD